jgi:hypothetical protein
VLLNEHDGQKGHLHLARCVDKDGRDWYELQIGSRQIGFWEGDWLYSETGYSIGLDGVWTRGASDQAHPCPYCALQGLDSEKPLPLPPAPKRRRRP